MDAAVQFPTTPTARGAKPIVLKGRMDVEDAFRAIMRNCLAQVRANEEGVARFHDQDCLHQMRVGLRRMRSALAMFEDVLSLPEPLQADLDWLVGQLGPARDWGVLAGTTLADVEEALPSASVTELKLAAFARMHALHEEAAAAVGAARYARFMQALEQWVSERGWRQALVPGDKSRLKMRAGAFARAILDKDQRRLRKRGQALPGATADVRHRVRIAAKKTRYAAEFFAGLLAQRAVKPYVKALAHLQDDLGRMNDAAVAAQLLDELVAHTPALAEGAGLVKAYLAGRTQADQTGLKRDWKAFAAKKVP